MARDGGRVAAGGPRRPVRPGARGGRGLRAGRGRSPTPCARGGTPAPAGLRAIAGHLTTAQPATAQAQAAADWDHAGPSTLTQDPPNPLPGYRLVEITITPGSPAAGRKLGDITWPHASTPVS